MDEFGLIDWIRQQAGPEGGDLRLGIGDDAAVLAVPSGQELVVTTDTLSSGIHFSPGDPPESVGHKALAVNLSDLAAMGAQPRWALLSITLPLGSENWVHGFIRGFLDLAAQFDVRLVGGDTGSGVLSVTVTALG
ncbi:MAG TPA: thiamine-phosphate kinase, partial [Xanthomonadales bacterium]|nr:thiamine-phosphate kinase [Xanthomonadales bacterium]